MGSLFPFDSKRKGQIEFIEAFSSCLENGKSMIAQAPTGIGKTVAALVPAVEYALSKNKTVVFMTPRHTQYKIVIDTLFQMAEKSGSEIKVANIVGKKWLCNLPIADDLSAANFYDYCKTLRKEKNCKFHSATIKDGKLTEAAVKKIKEIESKIMSAEMCKDHCPNLCPYEMILALSRNANVVVADYFHIFHPDVREMFLEKSGLEMKDLILVVDEGHNLAERIRELMSVKLSNKRISMAIKEASTHRFDDIREALIFIKSQLSEYAIKPPVKDMEKIVHKSAIVNIVNSITDYHSFVEELDVAASMVKSGKKASSIEVVANFLRKWDQSGKGFSRISRRFKDISGEWHFEFSFDCLDPSLVTKDVFNSVHSSLLMSGTLSPPDMYKEILGFEDDTVILSLDSPFPRENKLMLIMDNVTTRFSDRDEDEFYRIASNLVKIANFSDGNVGVFFPSYNLKDQIYELLKSKLVKPVLLELPSMSKKEKNDLLQRFEKYSTRGGAVLFGVVGANFSEGVDFPGELMNTSVIVGLPLSRPDLKLKVLIDYYQRMMGKGWDYAYIFPAMNRVFQAAGRCIRSKNDRGVVVLMDKRFLWPRYKNLLPRDAMIYVSSDIKAEIRYFFDGGCFE